MVLPHTACGRMGTLCNLSELQCLPLIFFFNGISALPTSQGGVIQYDDTGGS